MADLSLCEKAVNARIAAGILPGATFCVYRDDARIGEYTAGYADRDTAVPLRHDAIFRLASMTKPITAAAVLWCADHGKLRVTDPVSRYFPAYANRYVGKLDADGRLTAAEPAAREMTIEDILTHSSGLGSGPVGEAQFARLDRAAIANPAEAVRAYADWLLDFSPGSSQAYSPVVALDLAAAVVEKVSDMPYESFLRTRIFAPLGMRDTGYTLSKAQYTRLVPMVRLSDAATELQPAPMGRTGHNGFPVGAASGCSAMFGTRDDYANFARMLCNEGELAGTRVLSPEAVRRMRTPHFPVGFAGMDEYSDWGYTVRVRQRQTPNVQELSPGSYGWSGAFNTHFWVDPVLKIAAVFLSNMSNAGGAGSVSAFEFECNVMRSI